jgi:hypothetical protein
VSTIYIRFPLGVIRNIESKVFTARRDSVLVFVSFLDGLAGHGNHGANNFFVYNVG